MKKRRQYTEEFKASAVKLSYKKTTIIEAAEELGIPVETLQGWIKSYSNQSVHSDSRAAEAGQGENIKELLAEKKRLHKELSILKEKTAILKKAKEFFAKQIK